MYSLQQCSLAVLGCTRGYPHTFRVSIPSRPMASLFDIRSQIYDGLSYHPSVTGQPRNSESIITNFTLTSTRILQESGKT